MIEEISMLEGSYIDTNHPYESVVAMSVHKQDNPVWLKQSVESILEQSATNFLFLIVIDGPIVPSALNYLMKKSESELNVCLFQSKENRGLSFAMNFLIEFVLQNLPSVCFFFRMDADDISAIDRLQTQLDFMTQNNDISVVGSALEEVNEDGIIVGKRQLPRQHSAIYSVMVRRCAINHPTVCIRRRVFEAGFRYNVQLLNTQDYFLWIDIMAAGHKFANIPLSLLKFRRVNDFYKRRGIKKSINEFKARWYAMNQLNQMTMKNVSYAFLVIFLRLMPSKVLKLAYKIDRYFMSRK